MQNRLSFLFKTLFTLLIAALGFNNVLALTPAVHITPKPTWLSTYKPYDKKPLARDIQDGAYSELVEEQVNIDAKAVYNHFITDIVSDAGVQNNSEISVSFDPTYERVDFNEITVWRNNKPENRLNVDAFKMLPNEEEFDKFIYNGTYSAKYILSDIRKGDKIEYAYTVTGINPIFNNKFCRSIYLQGSDPIMHQYTTLLFSSSRKPNMKPFNLRSQPKITTTNGLTRYEWDDLQVPGVNSNKFEPKWINNYARVQVSEFNSWADVINWGLSINPIQTNFTGELADSIGNLKKRYGSNKEKYFRAAVMLVQDEVRYMGVETGQYSHKANTPDKVFKQRYGDCKDKSLLLASILNAGGIEAHLVLINTDLQNHLADFIPSAGLFDHAVVTATVNGKQVWIDATIANQRGKGTDLYFPNYGKGLVLKAGNNGLTDIPETKTGKITCLEQYYVTDEFTPVKFTVTTTYTLNQADEIRDDLATTGINKTEKDYLDYYSKTYSKIKAADSLIIKDNEGKNELTTFESYTIPSFFKRDSINGKYAADFYADLISHQLPDLDGQINTAVSVNYPYNVDYTIGVTSPGGWDIADEHSGLNRDAYKFAYDRTISGDNLSLRYRFAYLKSYVPASQVNEFRKDIKDLKDDQLSYSYYYIPDIKGVPFQLNHWMLILTVLVMCAFAYFGLKIYKEPTHEVNYFTRNSFPPALGGWLIILVITLITTPLGVIKLLFDDTYYGMSKWDFVSVGIGSPLYKSLLLFEVAGYVAVICYSVFCLVLIFKKRDITVYYLKRYYVTIVALLFIDFFFNSFVRQKISSYDIEQFIKAVTVSALWTYYLNTSERVRETFIVPYPNE